jgi:hypothetical protein
MMVRGHLLLAGLAWAEAAPRALAFLGLPPMDGATLGFSTTLAAAWGAWPDIDCPPAKAQEAGSGVRYGSLVAEAHGPASEAVSVLVYDAVGGHRRATHWAITSVALAGLLAVPSARWPVETLGVVLGLVAAWPVRAFLTPSWPRATVVGGLVGLGAALTMAPPAWLLPVAVAFGGLLHLVGDMIPKGSGVPVLGLPLPTKGDGRLARVGRWSRRRIGPGRWGLFTIGERVERQVVTPLLALGLGLSLAKGLGLLALAQGVASGLQLP